MNLQHMVEGHAQNGQLANAFALFNELSEKLTESYRELETQVATLSGELTEARSERLKQLTEKEILAGRLESLLDALPGAVIVLDGDDIIRQANPVAHDMLGDEITGIRWAELRHEVFLPDGDELRLRDGRWVSLSVRKLEAEQGRIILLADVSDTHELQEKLGRKQRLVSLGEMVASLAHQLRTPLTAAILYVSTLHHPRTQAQDIGRICNKTSERLHHLERMVNDMLIFARGEVTEFEHIDLAELLACLDANLREQYTAAAIELHINNTAPSGTCVLANADTLLSAFQNLADNALEAMLAKVGQQAGWQGELDIDVIIATDGRIEISFTDNGIGMSADTMDRILEPFYTTRSSGTGLGLAVVNASIESFHGKLAITSSEGSGSRFTASLPQATQDDVLPSGFANSDSTTESKFERKEVKI